MRKITGLWAALAGIVMALGLVVMSGAPAQAAYRIQISEIYYNSPGPDNGSNTSLNGEWVQLYNSSSGAVNMTHWTVNDAAGHVFRFATYSLGAHSYVKIHTGKGSRTQADRYWGLSWYVWNNTGDTATLKDNNGHVIDRCSYRDPNETHSHVSC
jgi:hypothetical protein